MGTRSYRGRFQPRLFVSSYFRRAAADVVCFVFTERHYRIPELQVDVYMVDVGESAHIPREPGVVRLKSRLRSLCRGR